MKTTGNNIVNTSSLRYLEDLYFVDSNKGLEKLQHKLQQTMRRENTKVRGVCSGMRTSCMQPPPLELKSYERVFCVNRVEWNEHYRSKELVETMNQEPDKAL